jgi:hypothetical protein
MWIGGFSMNKIKALRAQHKPEILREIERMEERRLTRVAVRQTANATTNPPNSSNFGENLSLFFLPISLFLISFSIFHLSVNSSDIQTLA